VTKKKSFEEDETGDLADPEGNPADTSGAPVSVADLHQRLSAIEAIVQKLEPHIAKILETVHRFS
jgi:hypothetical protein